MGCAVWVAFGSNATGNDNIKIGYETAPYVTTGSKNVTIGYEAVSSVTIGSNNVANGTKNRRTS